MDYTVSSISNNVNPGNATIIFRAVEGNEKGYVGSRSVRFRISKGRELKEGDGFSYVYEASVPFAQGGAKPSVTVKDGEKLLSAGKDYTLSYSGNKALTTGAAAVITVKGKGNYSGSVKLPFTVTAQQIAAMDISVADKTESKKGYRAPSVTVSDTNGKKLKAGRDYELCDDYTEPDAEGNVTVSLKGLGKYEGSVKISYRYIRASQQLSKVKAKALPEKSYTGRAVTLSNAELTGLLSDGDKILVPGTDFEVLAYSNNLWAGTAKVTLRGIGAYGGTLTLKFKIKGKKGSFLGTVDKG